MVIYSSDSLEFNNSHGSGDIFDCISLPNELRRTKPRTRPTRTTKPRSAFVDTPSAPKIHRDGYLSEKKLIKIKCTLPRPEPAPAPRPAPRRSTHLGVASSHTTQDELDEGVSTLLRQLGTTFSADDVLDLLASTDRQLDCQRYANYLRRNNFVAQAQIIDAFM